jgi:chloramphenicol 3-O-phosphotransferase
MTHRYNPYIVGSPVEGDNFYGRQALLDKIWSRPDKIIHLLGMRRVGKTSILKKLTTMGKAIYLDLQWAAWMTRRDWLLQLENKTWAKSSQISAEATLNLYEKTASD